MLDLKAGVHFEKIEALAGRVGAADDQLDRARRMVIHCARQRDALLAHRFTHLGSDEGRRRFLDHLLVAALDRAFALVEIENGAVLVAKDLDLDVARILDKFLDKHPLVAETVEALALGRLEAFLDVLVVPGEPHALAAAARAGLHHHRITDAIGPFERLGSVGDCAFGAGHGVDPGSARQLLALDLVAHRRDRSGGRADEGDPGGVERLDEARAFREETIARMHRLGACCLADLDDLVGEQIALRGRRRPYPHRLVGHADEGRARIGVGIDRHRDDTHPARGFDYPAGDLAAVGDEDFLEHDYFSVPALVSPDSWLVSRARMLRLRSRVNSALQLVTSIGSSEPPRAS